MGCGGPAGAGAQTCDDRTVGVRPRGPGRLQAGIRAAYLLLLLRGVSVAGQPGVSPGLLRLDERFRAFAEGAWVPEAGMSEQFIQTGISLTSFLSSVHSPYPGEAPVL